MTPSFDKAEWLHIPGRGKVAIIQLNNDISDFSHIVGRNVLIDGNEYRCSGVEVRGRYGPWRAGEPIGLLVVDI